jgi:hypothetical protein
LYNSIQLKAIISISASRRVGNMAPFSLLHSNNFGAPQHSDFEYMTCATLEHDKSAAYPILVL